MSSPTLTFTPAMFQASMKGIKDTTRRLAQVSRQNHIDQVAAAIADDDEMAFWKENTHLCAHQPGEIKPIVTTWAVHTDWNDVKPSDIDPNIVLGEIAAQYSGGIWFNDGSKKPDWAGKARPGRFLPKSLYPLAPQVEILTVHPEFLLDITEASALREGVERLYHKYYCVPNHKGESEHQHVDATGSYFRLWDSINAERDIGQFAAKRNPAVWVITYRLLPKP